MWPNLTKANDIDYYMGAFILAALDFKTFVAMAMATGAPLRTQSTIFWS